MHPKINAAARMALYFLALNGSEPCVLRAAPAWAEADAAPTVLRPLCEEGRAVLAGRLGYLEARISPAPDQQQAWQEFKTAVRAAVEPLNALCDEGPAAGASSPDRLERMEKSAAALQKMFAGLRAATAGIRSGPDLVPTRPPRARHSPPTTPFFALPPAPRHAVPAAAPRHAAAKRDVWPPTATFWDDGDFLWK